MTSFFSFYLSISGVLKNWNEIETGVIGIRIWGIFWTEKAGQYDLLGVTHRFFQNAERVVVLFRPLAHSSACFFEHPAFFRALLMASALVSGRSSSHPSKREITAFRNISYDMSSPFVLVLGSVIYKKYLICQHNVYIFYYFLKMSVYFSDGRCEIEAFFTDFLLY